MATIRWGIIGCGDVTEVKSGPALYKTRDSELVAVMRRDADKARDYAARHGVPKWYDQADALIADPDVDAVYIATPPDTHAHYTAQVARAGKPVYVEKPMARNHGECLAMIDACRRAGVPLFVAYYRRALPAFLKVQSLVEEGAIGAVRFASIALCQPASEDPDNLPWRVVPEISGGGYFFDLASHQLDFLDFLLGPIARASGQATNQAGLYQAEDAVTASFAFESGRTRRRSLELRRRPALRPDRNRRHQGPDRLFHLRLHPSRINYQRRDPNLRHRLAPTRPAASDPDGSRCPVGPRRMPQHRCKRRSH